MKKRGVNGLLSAVILIGIFLGAAGAIALNRIVEGHVFENFLAKTSYEIYKDNWNNIKDGKKVRLGFNPLYSYSILTVDFILGHPRDKNITSFIWGFRRLREGDYREAAVYFEKLLNDEAYNLGPAALLYYGYCMQQDGKYNEAINAYLHLDRHFNDKYPEAIYNLAVVYEKTGDTYKAGQYYSKYAGMKTVR